MQITFKETTSAPLQLQPPAADVLLDYDREDAEDVKQQQQQQQLQQQQKLKCTRLWPRFHRS